MRVGRFISKFLIIALLLIFAIILTTNIWLPKAVESVACKWSPFPLKIEKSDCKLMNGRIDFKNVTLKNPDNEFSKKDFLGINEIVFDVDVPSLKTDTILINEIVFDIDSVTIVKNKYGAYNAQRFAENIKQLITDLNGKKKKSNKKQSDDDQQKQISINKLIVALGSVDLIDESSKGSQKKYTPSYRKEFTNIDDIGKIKTQLIRDLGKYGMQIFVDSIFDTALSSIPTIGNLAHGVATGVKDAAVGAADKAKKAVKTGIGKMLGK